VVHEPHVYLLSPRFGGSLYGRGFLLHCERGNLLVYSSSTLEADLKRSRSSAALSANTSTTATKRDRVRLARWFGKMNRQGFIVVMSHRSCVRQAD
jgi:hypothetical protein